MALAAAMTAVPLFIVAMAALAHVAQQRLLGQPLDGSWLLLGFCLLWLRHGLLAFKEWQTAELSRQLRSQLRRQWLAQLLPLGDARQQLGDDASLSVALTEKIDALDGYYSRYQLQVPLVLFTPLAIAFAVSWHSGLAALLLLATAPLVPFFMVLVGKEAARASDQQLQRQSQLASVLYQFLQQLPVLRRLQALPAARLQLQASSERYRTSALSVLRLAFLSTAVLELFSALAIALVAVYLGLGLLKELPWAKGTIPVAFEAALFILLLAPEFYQPLRQLGADYHAKAQAQAAALQLQGLAMNPQQALPEPGQAQHSVSPMPLTLTAIQVHALAQEPSLRLELAHLAMAAGERLLLSGASGSGKSSLLQLLAGFLPFAGQYQLGGRTIGPKDRPWLWAQVGYLSQRAELLPASIADNLRLAAAHADDASLIAVLSQVGLWQELQASGRDLAFCVGEQGQGLSGGQQQRLAIARLLLCDRPLWLFDEPFAELDTEQRQQLAGVIERCSRGKTLLVASHQTAELGFLDGVIVLSHGRILDDSRGLGWQMALEGR